MKMRETFLIVLAVTLLTAWGCGTSSSDTDDTGDDAQTSVDDTSVATSSAEGISMVSQMLGNGSSGMSVGSMTKVLSEHCNVPASTASSPGRKDSA